MTGSLPDRLTEQPLEKMAAAGAMPPSIMQIPVAVQVVIGSTRLPLSRVAELGSGSVIALDQKLGSPAVILVNGKEVAQGELFVIEGEGNRLGIKLTSIAGQAGQPSA